MPMILDHPFQPVATEGQAVVLCGHIMLAGRDGKGPIVCGCTEAQHATTLAIEETRAQQLAKRARTAREAADILYPPNTPVGDPESSDPEDNEGMSDPYGYDELANKAFIEGAGWASVRFARTIEQLKNSIAEWELAQ